MTDHVKSIVDDERDLELMVNFLQGRLDPAQVRAVRRRLDEDAAFRDLVAPLLLTWSVPNDLEEFPRPEGEWEREWEKFKQRPGYSVALAQHQAEQSRGRRAWRATARAGKRVWNWWSGWRGFRSWQGLRVLLLLWLGVAMVHKQLTFDPYRGPSADDGRYVVVPFDTGWMPVGDLIEARLEQGATLRVRKKPIADVWWMDLEGTARFRVLPNDPFKPHELRDTAIRLFTRGGIVTAGESEFRVIARGDTTMVMVSALERRQDTQPTRPTVQALTVLEDGAIGSAALLDREGAILIPGQLPKPLKSTIIGVRVQ